MKWNDTSEEESKSMMSSAEQLNNITSAKKSTPEWTVFLFMTIDYYEYIWHSISVKDLIRPVLAWLS